MTDSEVTESASVQLQSLLKALEFASQKHRDQRRKGFERAPYVNHLIEVARLLADANVTDPVTLQAAVLHDVLEDTSTSRDELVAEFGEEVCRVVEEVTDQKSLPKHIRKLLQIHRAGGLSARAKVIKIADKISNIRAVVAAPPQDWDLQRRKNYLDWTMEVVQGCRGNNASLERLYDETLEQCRHSLSQQD